MARPHDAVPEMEHDDRVSFGPVAQLDHLADLDGNDVVPALEQLGGKNHLIGWDRHVRSKQWGARVGRTPCERLSNIDRAYPRSSSNRPEMSCRS